MSRWDGGHVLAKPHGNTFAVGKNRFRWAEFDVLPRLVRDVLNYAPLRLGSMRAFDAMMAGGPPEAIARQEVAIARRHMARHTLETYGPDHPQAPQDATSAE